MRMGAQPIKTWSLMKQSLRNRFRIGNHEAQRQGQSMVKFMELLKVEDSLKVKELSQAKIEESLKIHLFSLVFMENGYQFYFLNSIGTLPEKKHFIEFNSISCAIPKVDEYHFNIANYASCVLGAEDKGRNLERELGAILEELPISLSLKPSLMCYEEILLKDFENRIGLNLELFKVNPLAFETSNLRKEAFEQEQKYKTIIRVYPNPTLDPGGSGLGPEFYILKDMGSGRGLSLTIRNYTPYFLAMTLEY
ncbi:hypothetical protein M9H77_35630 [Catharanthus roseus]|uniref:Uncharacterized protein n=1 Tax=Catharanthus roseus TaxID=4058 RepID=A0ACB9ZPU4_CATRO|nr:hypothetical protein M9H77_35630 [Catharanthus roseus]